VDDNTILVTKKDEVYAKIHCERAMAKELSEYFTFVVPGCQFSPAFRNKIWDGKIRLYNLQSSTIYLGLLSYIEEFANERDYVVEYGDPRPDLADEYSLIQGQEFIDSLCLHANGKDLETRDYQLNAFVHAIRSRRVLLLSPTASGKSLIIYAIIMMMRERGLRGLILVPTTSLVEQLYSDFQEYSTKNDFDVEANVHRIYQGKDKVTNKGLIISTWQSLYTLPEDYFKQFDFVIGDEAHLFKAKSLTHIMSSCINAKYRVGLTGSLDNTKTHKLVLEGLFGPVRKVTTTRELMDRKQLAELYIKCLVLKHPEKVCEQFKLIKDYQAELEYLVTNDERNNFIKNLALSLGKNTLILYQFVDKQGRVLYDKLLASKNLGDKKVYFIHGGVEAEEREMIRKLLEKEDGVIIVASYGTFSTGVNMRNLHHVIFASPSKSRIRNLQSIGRGLRTGDNKTEAILFDIADDMRSGKKMNVTLKHFVERVRLYNEEKFPYKIYKIGLKNGNNGSK